MLFGALCAAKPAPGFIALSISAARFVAIGVMVAISRKRMGFFINGYRRGRTRAVAISVESIFFASLRLIITQHIAWAPFAGGALIVPIVVLASFRWQAAYRSENGSGNATCST